MEALAVLKVDFILWTPCGFFHSLSSFQNTDSGSYLFFFRSSVMGSVYVYVCVYLCIIYICVLSFFFYIIAHFCLNIAWLVLVEWVISQKFWLPSNGQPFAEGKMTKLTKNSIAQCEEECIKQILLKGNMRKTSY